METFQLISVAVKTGSTINMSRELLLLELMGLKGEAGLENALLSSRWGIQPHGKKYTLMIKIAYKHLLQVKY